MNDPVLQEGQSEVAKGIIHALMLSGHLMCFTYNSMAYMERRQGHLLRNVIAHGLGAGWEFVQVLDHLK